MKDIYSSRNEVVDKIGQMHFSGNIIPATWYKTIVRDNKKPYLNAIIILSDVVYWYRPTEVRDEQSGQLIGFKKKFRDDLLQRSYQQIADQFGMSKREATNAVVFLEKLGVIEREFRTIKAGGTILNNVLYLKLNAEVLYTITFERDTLSLDKERVPTLKRETLSLNKDIPITLNGETNTKNTTKNSNKDFDIDYPLYSSDGDDQIGIIEKKKKALKAIKENVSYEILIQQYPFDIELIDSYLEIMVDIYIQDQGTVRINSQEKPIEIVKSQFMKLNMSHIEYVMISYRENTTKIKNQRNYMLTTLYNAPFTKDQFYQSLVNYDMYGDKY
ncbi:MAG: DUF6017 domain-containing protein [Peptoniphilaceae bacterium]